MYPVVYILPQVYDELNMKNKELKSTQVHMEKLQCTLTCETEKNSSLQIDLSMTERDLSDLQQKYNALDGEMMQLKQQHKETVCKISYFVIVTTDE